MKVTKYPQSCLLIEKDGTRIVIDPGSVFSAEYSVSDLGSLDAVLYTHQHADHFDPELVKEFSTAGVALYGNASVVELIEDTQNTTEVVNGKSFEIANFSITPYDLPHCLMPDGSEGPPNTGYLINDAFFHPGDGTEIDGFTANTVAAPMAGPDISPKDTLDLLRNLSAKNVIPIHNDVFKVDAKIIATFSERFGLTYNWIMLENGESTEL